MLYAAFQLDMQGRRSGQWGTIVSTVNEFRITATYIMQNQIFLGVAKVYGKFYTYLAARTKEKGKSVCVNICDNLDQDILHMVI
jgi:hypothetical protein